LLDTGVFSIAVAKVKQSSKYVARESRQQWPRRTNYSSVQIPIVMSCIEQTL